MNNEELSKRILECINQHENKDKEVILCDELSKIDNSIMIRIIVDLCEKIETYKLFTMGILKQIIKML